MAEEKQDEEIKPTTKKEEKQLSMIEQANAAAERLEKANIEYARLNKEREEIETRRMLGGHADAGIQPPKPAEETPKEYAARIMRGGK